MSEAEPTQEEVVQQLHAFAAEQMIAGKSRMDIEASLIEMGLDAESSRIIVDNVHQMKSSGVREAGKSNMLYGALWVIGGTVITVGTLAAASEGGTYVVTWGAIIFGGIQFVRGFFQYVSEG